MVVGPVLFLLPMHFTVSIARNWSPIIAVIVVVSGFDGISPFDLIKRTSIPMVGAMLVNVGVTIVCYMIGW